MTGYFTTMQVGQLTGVTLRQLQWWVEQGWVTPAPKLVGHSRQWTLEMVDVVRRIKVLRKVGLSHAEIQHSGVMKVHGWRRVKVARGPLVEGDTLIVPVLTIGQRRRKA